LNLQVEFYEKGTDSLHAIPLRRESSLAFALWRPSKVSLKHEKSLLCCPSGGLSPCRQTTKCLMLKRIRGTERPAMILFHPLKKKQMAILQATARNPSPVELPHTARCDRS